MGLWFCFRVKSLASVQKLCTSDVESDKRKLKKEANNIDNFTVQMSQMSLLPSKAAKNIEQGC